MALAAQVGPSCFFLALLVAILLFLFAIWRQHCPTSPQNVRKAAKLKPISANMAAKTLQDVPQDAQQDVQQDVQQDRPCALAVQQVFSKMFNKMISKMISKMFSKMLSKMFSKTVSKVDLAP